MGAKESEKLHRFCVLTVFLFPGHSHWIFLESPGTPQESLVDLRAGHSPWVNFLLNSRRVIDPRPGWS